MAMLYSGHCRVDTCELPGSLQRWAPMMFTIVPTGYFVASVQMLCRSFNCYSTRDPAGADRAE